MLKGITIAIAIAIAIAHGAVRALQTRLMARKVICMEIWRPPTDRPTDHDLPDIMILYPTTAENATESKQSANCAFFGPNFSKSSIWPFAYSHSLTH